MATLLAQAEAGHADRAAVAAGAGRAEPRQRAAAKPAIPEPGHLARQGDETKVELRLRVPCGVRPRFADPARIDLPAADADRIERLVASVARDLDAKPIAHGHRRVLLRDEHVCAGEH